MFEEICLVCGKHLFDYGSAYCSDDCQGRDATSPSISSSSSALSSPHLGYAHGADVPPLIPSVLGSALKNLRGRSPYSGIASAGCVSTDDDDDRVSLAVRAEYPDGAELAPEGALKPLGYPSALQYTRRPSGTNNQSTVPHVHRRMSSTSSSSGRVGGIPQSAPLPSHSSTEDDDAYSDLGLSSRENAKAETEESDAHLERVEQESGKRRRSRNRASLPAYFSLLQMSSPGGEARSSPVSSSSGRTIARASPPTPKLALGSLGQAVACLQTTPRGRRRVPCESRSNHRSDSSSSRSRPGTQQVAGERGWRSWLDGDWSSVPGEASRGRRIFRRNKTPPPKMLFGMEERGRNLAIVERSQSGEERRGRVGLKELNGIGYCAEAPGFGSGRSGLVGRERERERTRVGL